MEHMEILEAPEPQIAIRSSTVDFVEYEVRFFVARQANETLVSAQYLDLAFQHLDSLAVSRAPVGAASAEIGTRSFDERLIADADPLSSLSANVRTKLASQLQQYRLAPDQPLANDGIAPRGMLFVRSGVLSVSVKDQAGTREIARLHPGDDWVTMEGASCFIKALSSSRFVLIPGEVLAPFYEAHAGIIDSLKNLAGKVRNDSNTANRSLNQACAIRNPATESSHM
jgi:hypothetical protein